jgi:hypothetical protein
VYFFSEKGAVSNFFFRRGAVGQKRLGTSGLNHDGIGQSRVEAG